MKQSLDVTGESLDHKLGAIFEDEARAKSAADSLRGLEGLDEERVFVLRPGDKHPGWELEPEDKGIWRTLVRAHIKLGLVGFALGLALYIVLTGLGVSFVVFNPFASAAVLIALCTILGLMLGGLITIRPDHIPYIVTAQEALREGKYVVAVHASSHDQLRRAKAELDSLNAKTFSSL